MAQPSQQEQTARSIWIHTGDSDKCLSDKEQKRIKQHEQKTSFRVKKMYFQGSDNLFQRC